MLQRPHFHVTKEKKNFYGLTQDQWRYYAVISSDDKNILSIIGARLILTRT